MIQFSRKGFTLIEVMLVVAIIAILLSVVIPSYIKSTEASMKTVCINNLRKIDAAIEEWAAENHVMSGTQPTQEQEGEIYSYIRNGKPSCPAGGGYTIYTVGSVPQVRCSLEDKGHKLLD